MPAGAAIFDQTDPRCLPNPDGSFRCTLSRQPAGEEAIYLDAKEVLAIDGVAAGGCIGLDFAGMTWDCFIGQAAATERSSVRTSSVSRSPVPVGVEPDTVAAARPSTTIEP